MPGGSHCSYINFSGPPSPFERCFIHKNTVSIVSIAEDPIPVHQFFFKLYSSNMIYASSVCFLEVIKAQKEQAEY